MTPRASFVIPAYNSERWISKAIFSCRNQTTKQIEIVVVNDGSTDATKEIIEWHAAADKRVIAFHMEQNKGRSYARNLGNDAARANLIFVLDADDMATRNRVKDTLAIFELKKPDLVYGAFHVIDSLDNVSARISAAPFNPEISKSKKLNFICHSTVAYSKKVSQEIRYDEGEYSRLGLDDWKFQWDAFNKGFILRHLKNPLCYYRQTDDTVTSTRNEEEVAKVKEAFLASI